MVVADGPLQQVIHLGWSTGKLTKATSFIVAQLDVTVRIWLVRTYVSTIALTNMCTSYHCVEAVIIEQMHLMFQRSVYYRSPAICKLYC